MALIVCQKCGNNISSLARFCPKCNRGENKEVKRPPRLVALSSAGENKQEKESESIDEETNFVELLHQHDFKPSLDEMILLKGTVYLIKSTFSIIDCYAYLTSKRYVLCDPSELKIIFQIGIDKIVFAEEGRHLLSKKIVVTTASSETFQIKCQPHSLWLSALTNPKDFAEIAEKRKTVPSNVQAGTVEWFYEDVDGNVGPLKEKIIVQLIQNNHTIFPQTKVWNATLPEWKEAKDTILTIYFSESVTYGVVQNEKSHFSRFAVINMIKNIMPLFRKYI